MALLQLVHDISQKRVLIYFQRQQLVKPTKIGILNTQSIGNKFRTVLHRMGLVSSRMSKHGTIQMTARM